MTGKITGRKRTAESPPTSETFRAASTRLEKNNKPTAGDVDVLDKVNPSTQSTAHAGPPGSSAGALRGSREDLRRQWERYRSPVLDRPRPSSAKPENQDSLSTSTIGSADATPESRRVPPPLPVEWHNHFNGVLTAEEYLRVFPVAPKDLSAPLERVEKHLSGLSVSHPPRLSRVAARLTDLIRNTPPDHFGQVLTWFMETRNEKDQPPSFSPSLISVHFDEAYVVRKAVREIARADAGQLTRDARPFANGGALIPETEIAATKADLQTYAASLAPDAVCYVTLGPPAKIKTSIRMAVKSRLELLREVLEERRMQGLTVARLHLSAEVLDFDHYNAVFAALSRHGITTVDIEGKPTLPNVLLDYLHLRHGVDVRFLCGLDTHLLSAEGEEPVRNAIRGLKSSLRLPRVVGIDIRGPEAWFTSLSVARFLDAARTELDEISASIEEPKARLLIRLHVGEGNTRTEEGERTLHATVKNQSQANIAAVLTALKEGHGRRAGEAATGDVRLGHLTHLQSRHARLILEMGIPAELNLGSNMRTQTSPSMAETPLCTLLIEDMLQARFEMSASKLCLTLNTDGTGVMATSPSAEAALAERILESFLGDRHSESAKTFAQPPYLEKAQAVARMTRRDARALGANFTFPAEEETQDRPTPESFRSIAVSGSFFEQYGRQRGRDFVHIWLRHVQEKAEAMTAATARRNPLIPETMRPL